MRNFFKDIKATAKAVKAKVCGFVAMVRDRFRMRAVQTRVKYQLGIINRFIRRGNPMGSVAYR